jgi:hypothetical protein
VSKNNGYDVKKLKHVRLGSSLDSVGGMLALIMLALINDASLNSAICQNSPSGN